MNRLLLLLLSISVTSASFSQAKKKDWKGKQCAVVLTYDDALNVHLDKVIPALDSLNFKGTFYLIASAPVVANRAEEWRAAAKKGHELGNHSLYHPCDGSLPGRSFVSKEKDLSRYTVKKAISEIRSANDVLQSIDNKKRRTFAFPCGDRKIRDTVFYDSLKTEFAGARGVSSRYDKIPEIDLSNIDAFSQAGSTGESMIEQVKQAEKTGSLIVFLFHGVGGEHSLNVDFAEHQKLLNYLHANRKHIWIAPMLDVANYVKKSSLSRVLILF